ncbi:MAG TPA: hypothetical protein DCM45_00525, partial [Clostridiales bacterium]|nr:hypothetical protein [Clostridiales bacterium]
KYEKALTGNFEQFLHYLHDSITRSSMSVTYEDGSDVNLGQVKMAVRVYERYSMFGGNRVSLNITILGQQDNLFVTAITSGGSQAVFIKINTVGEDTFLQTCIDAIEAWGR